MASTMDQQSAAQQGISPAAGCSGSVDEHRVENVSDHPDRTNEKIKPFFTWFFETSTLLSVTYENLA
jgi:hypothetical protein